MAQPPSPHRPWLPMSSAVLVLSLGLAGMFSLTVYGLLQDSDAGLWSKGEHSHGPIMLALALWLLITRWREQPEAPKPPLHGANWAWLAFFLGSAMFVIGRALGIIYFEVGAFIPMLSGVVLLLGGTALLRKLKFPIFFLIFMIPLPGFLVDPISQFVKLRISEATANILWSLNYPISHTGVIINIGQYQLLVADACAGMRTLFMLEAMGIFYLNVAKHSSVLRNVLLSLLIIPISFVANLTRVIVLALITYHFGDEAGQGFLHGFAGIVLFVVALSLMISLDTLLRNVSDKKTKALV